ncbi:hypothetical protein TNCV_4247071 [Trichonephila clavipes]|nr:hypothetical protein TNCV_4247071 [Trichonephila clavipes]
MALIDFLLMSHLKASQGPMATDLVNHDQVTRDTKAAFSSVLSNFIITPVRELGTSAHFKMHLISSTFSLNKIDFWKLYAKMCVLLKLNQLIEGFLNICLTQHVPRRLVKGSQLSLGHLDLWDVGKKLST